MKLVRIIVFLIFLCSLSDCIAFGGGSTYSRFGIGDLLYYGGNRSYGMGGAGIATLGSDFLNQYNPAGLSKIFLTQFSGSMEFERFTSSAVAGSSIFNTFGFQSLCVAIPISTEYGVVLSLESTPYSEVRYAVQRTDTILNSATNETFYGSGGISMLALGLSCSITNTLHIGLKLQSYSGKTDQYLKANFNSPDISNADYEHYVHYEGIGFTAGFIAEDFGTLVDVDALKSLALGMVISSPVSLSTAETVYYPSLDTSSVQNGTSDLPLTVGIGASYNIENHFQIVSDFIFQNWKNTKYMGNPEPEIRNAMRLGIGFEILPQKKSLSYWGRLAYRLGGYYHSTYYHINGTDINEIGATTGLGIPLGPDGQINVGFQLGFRGTTSNNLQKDTIFRLSIGVSVNELWFMKFEEE